MSVFKRAEWSSGLTYRQTCDECKTTFTYMDNLLDFRPWYADGFVYCPGCQKPLRHSERYAINGPASATTVDADAPSSGALFCTQCGHKFNDTDKFCPQCGTKR